MSGRGDALTDDLASLRFAGTDGSGLYHRSQAPMVDHASSLAYLDVRHADATRLERATELRERWFTASLNARLRMRDDQNHDYPHCRAACSHLEGLAIPRSKPPRRSPFGVGCIIGRRRALSDSAPLRLHTFL